MKADINEAKALQARIIGAKWLTDSQKAILLGVIDQSFGADVVPLLADLRLSEQYADLRAIFAGGEFLQDENGDETGHIYLRMQPFDVKLSRGDGLLKVDIFGLGEEASLDPLASATAYEEQG